MAARCSYCGAELRPNSMFCLACGQLATGGRRSTPAPVSDTSEVPPKPSASVPPPPAVAPVPPPPAGAAGPDAQGLEARIAAAPSVGVPGLPQLVFTTGQTLVVREGTVLLGRRPEDIAAAEGAAAFALDDPDRSTSRVHAAVVFGPTGLRVVDRGSGNGTVLRRGDREDRCPEGLPVELVPGDELWFGSVGARVR
ncbi:zinc-ribbon domain-containing protein [Curtobacterium sp. 9128]|uniref:zinc-ribbon domain-containing protein n=1 Tax=Curtobacterium sp. 9128 TaxID=1793722 RepID=UPI0011A5F746|nr:zinc-ribbon domain-containing protein [Curtobacterium sp. 9128]